MMIKTLGGDLIPADCIESCKYRKKEQSYEIKALGQTFYATKADAQKLLPQPAMVPADAGTWALDPETKDRIGAIVAWRADGRPVLADPEAYPLEMPDGRVVDDTDGVVETFELWRACDE